MTTSLADYNHLKRRYYQALNLRGAPPTRKVPVSKSAPVTIASPEGSPARFEEEIVYSSSVGGYSSSPIPVPSNEDDPDSGLDGDFGYSKSATFIPPHLLAHHGGEEDCSFSMYEYQKKRQICKNAF